MRRIETLSSGHNRLGFDCGIPALNRYLQETARQHASKGIARSFVLVDDPEPAQIIGYYTLSVCEIQSDNLPPKLARKFPRMIPAARLARLAVSASYQRQGIGRLLVVDSMSRTLTVAKSVGIIGLFVDAKDKTAAGYYAQYGFIPLPDQPLTLFLPIKTLKQALE